MSSSLRHDSARPGSGATLLVAIIVVGISIANSAPSHPSPYLNPTVVAATQRAPLHHGTPPHHPHH